MKLAVLVVVGSLAGFATSSVQAAGEFELAIAGLRSAGMYQQALDQLAKARADANFPAESKPGLLIEEAKTYIAWADSGVPFAFGVPLDRAELKLTEFLTSAAQHPLADIANIELAVVHLTRGHEQLARSEQFRAGDQERQKAAVKLNSQARGELRRARELLEDVIQRADRELNALVTTVGSGTPSTEQLNLRNRLRFTVLEASSQLGQVLFEAAHVEPAASKARRTDLLAAARYLQAVHDRWPKHDVGQLALVRKGRCLQELGDFKGARDLYLAVVESPGPASLRPQKNTALALLLRCLIDPSLADAAEAERRGSLWLAAASQEELKDDDGLAVRFYTALAQALLANQLPKEQAALQASMRAAAREHALVVSHSSSIHRGGALWLLDALAKESIGAGFDLEKLLNPGQTSPRDKSTPAGEPAAPAKLPLPPQ